MALALAEARAAAAAGEVPVGAVVVKDGVVIAAAGNRRASSRTRPPMPRCSPSARACAALGDERLAGCDLYVTLEPCTCARRRSRSRASGGSISAPPIRRAAPSSTAPRFFTQPTCHHAPDVYGGLAESEAGMLLQAFFAERR